MEINKIPKLARQIALQYGYTIPIIRLSKNMTRKIGYADKYRRITLNQKFCEINSEEIIISLLKHEIAHFIFKGHNQDFKDELIRMNCHDSFIGSCLKLSSDIKQVITEPKYVYQCPVGHIYKYQRLMQREGHRSCGKCDRKFNLNYLLRRIK